MAKTRPEVTELPAQNVGFLFGTMMDLRMLPSELKHTGKVGKGEFKIVAHFPAKHAQDGTEAAYLARHRTFRGGLYATYQDGPYKIDEMNWDATSRAGVHLVTETKYGQVVEFPTQPSKSMPGSLKLMVQEYVESLKVPGFIIRCSGLGGALEPKKGTKDEYDLVLLNGDVKCPKKLANHVPAKYHAEEESIFLAQAGPYSYNAEELSDQEQEYLGNAIAAAMKGYYRTGVIGTDPVISAFPKGPMSIARRSDAAKQEFFREPAVQDRDGFWNKGPNRWQAQKIAQAMGYQALERAQSRGMFDAETANNYVFNHDNGLEEDIIRLQEDESRVKEKISYLQEMIHEKEDMMMNRNWTPESLESMRYDVREMKHKIDMSQQELRHIQSNIDSYEGMRRQLSEVDLGAETFAAVSTARPDVNREKKNVINAVRDAYDNSFTWSACRWGPYFVRLTDEGSNKFYSVWVWERSPGIFTAMGAYGGLGQKPRLFNVGQTRDLQQAVNMAQKKLTAKNKKGYVTYSAEVMAELGDSDFPVVPNTGGGNTALGSGRGVPQWYGAEQYPIVNPTVYEQVNGRDALGVGLPVIANDFGQDSAGGIGHGVPQMYGAESAFDKLADKVAQGYMKKGMSRKEAMEIGRKTAYKIGARKYGKAGMARKAREGRMRRKAEYFESPYAGGSALSDVGLSTDQLTATVGSGTFDEASLNSSGHMNVFANAEEFEAPMPRHKPSRQDVDRVVAAIKQRYKGVRMKGRPNYITDTKDGANKYHVFVRTNKGNFNGYGRINHTMTLFGPMGDAQFESKMRQKLRKGYKETAY